MTTYKRWGGGFPHVFINYKPIELQESLLSDQSPMALIISLEQM